MERFDAHQRGIFPQWQTHRPHRLSHNDQPPAKSQNWAVYRDEVTDIDALATTLKEMISATCVWQSETVHD